MSRSARGQELPGHEPQHARPGAARPCATGPPRHDNKITKQYANTSYESLHMQLAGNHAC